MSATNRWGISPRAQDLIFYSSLSFLFLFQGRYALIYGHGFDESCYLEQLHAFFNEPFQACYSTSHFKGTAATWVVPGVFAKLFAFLTGSRFSTVALALIGITGFFQWVASLFLLDKTFRNVFEKHRVEVSWKPHYTVLLLLATPATNYVFRYPYFSHAAELLLMSAFLFALTEKRFMLATFAATWLFFTRLNDVFVFLMLGVLFVEWLKSQHFSKNALKFGIGLLAVVSAVCAFVFYRICFVTGYNGLFLSDVLSAIKPSGLYLAFFHQAAGLLNQNFLWLFIFACLTAKLHRVDNVHRVVWLSQLGFIALYVSLTVFWGFPEIRYLIASYLAAYWALLSNWDKLGERTKKSFVGLVLVGAVWRTWYYLVSIPPVLRWVWEQFGLSPGDDFTASLLLLAHPDFVSRVTLGLSPILYSWFSIAPNAALFEPLSAYKNFALKGPALISLIAVAIVCVCCSTSYLIWKWRSSQRAQLRLRTSE